MDCDSTARADFLKDVWLKRLLEQANQDVELVDRAHELSVRILVDTGENCYPVHLHDGSWTFLGKPRIDDSWDVALKASLSSWRKFFSRVPPPGYQSFMALRSTDPGFALEGNQLLAAQALPVLERLAEVARQGDEQGAHKVGEDTRATQFSVKRNPAQLIGRYLDLPDQDGKPWRIYYEEAGSGIPLILLHTAGADSRQFHDLLCDVEIAAHWRMLAFDLPFHGRSTPAHG